MFLLVAAAAVFVGVRWSELPLEAKTAIVGGVTGAVLLTGARLRHRLPVTATALVHLGAFLLPVDLAALAGRLDVAWPRIAIAEGVLLSVAFPLLARVVDSRVLRWSALAGVVSLATGLGATTGVPAPVTVAVVAAGTAVVARLRATRDPYAAGLAVVAAAGPAVVAALAGATGGLAATTAAGWAGPTSAVLALAPGLLAALALGVEAGDRRSAVLGHLALLAPVAAVVSLLARADVTRAAMLLSWPLLLVLLEAVALAARRDPLWRVPTRRLAAAAELAALLAAPSALWTVAVPFLEEIFGAAGPVGAAGGSPAAAAWLSAAVGIGLALARRDGGRREAWWLPGVVLAGLFGAAGAAGATGDVLAPAAVGVATGLVTVLAPRLEAVIAGVALAVAAVMSVAVTADRPVGVLVLAAVALVAGVVPVRRGIRAGRPGTVSALLGVLGSLTAAAVGLSSSTLLSGPIAAALWAVVAVGLAAAIDDDRTLADLARGSVLFVPLLAAAQPAEDAVLPLLVAAVLLAVETVRLDRPWLAVVAAVPAHHALVALGLAGGLSAPVAGLGLVLVAVGWAGIGLALDGAWRAPVLTIAGTVAGAGWLLTLAEQRPAGVATLVLGAATVTAGTLTRTRVATHVGGGLLSLGAWLLLDAAGTRVIEAYVAPVAAHLLLAGIVARRRDPSIGSWPAYAPAILVLAGPAAAERLAGGGGWHAVVVGAVGVAALTAGALRRLAAPLVLGVLLLVATTLHEALAVVASVPTWAWLGAGGAVLLGAGVALERAGTSPAAAGRRLVAGFGERFI